MTDQSAFPSSSDELDDMVNYLAEFEPDENRFDVEPGSALTAGITRLTPGGQLLARLALEAWSNVTGIRFELVHHFDDADIWFDDEEFGAFARADYVFVNDELFSKKVFVNVHKSHVENLDAKDDIQTADGFRNGDVLFYYIHEIGHALGLGHPGSYDGPGFEDQRIFGRLDSTAMTVMSYFHDNPYGDYGHSMTPMLADIDAIQSVYGKPDNINPGDTVYGYNSNVDGYLGEFFRLWAAEDNSDTVRLLRTNILTLYDNGGNDTLDLRTDTHDQRVDLNPFSISDVYGRKGNLFIHGDTLIENYVAGSGDDHITGNQADNRLNGGAGADYLDGGPGSDTVDYSDSDARVTVNLTTGEGAGGHAQGDRIAGIESVIGSALEDRLTGDDGNNVLAGNAGADYLDGGAGSDTVNYNDSDAGVTVNLITGEGAGGHAQGDELVNIESVIGSAFDDQLTGDAGPNYLEGGEGSDTVNYSASDAGVTVDLSTGEGAGGHAQGDRFAGIESVIGSAFDDRLTGDTGNNSLAGGGGADYLEGGEGSDTVNYNDSDAGVTVNLIAGEGAGGHAQGDELVNIESVIGSAFDDRLTGDDGNNVLAGGAGADRLDGGAGTDWLSYAGSDGAVSVRLYDGYAARGHAEGDTISGFENVRGSAYPDALAGSGGDNRLAGGAGNDRLRGGSGDDMLEGGAGADFLDGGPGSDAVGYSDSDAGVTVNLSTGESAGGHAQGDRFAGIESVIGSAFDDRLTGDNSNNVLDGGAGNDYLEGGPGADRLAGGGGQDVADYANSAGGVTVRLHAFLAGGGDAEGDTFIGTVTVEYTDEAGMTQEEELPDIVHLRGSSHDDTLAGDRRNNALWGNDGNDVLYGGPGGGDDYLNGGAGDDKLYGGAGNDLLEDGAGNDFLHGGAGDDHLHGGAGDDHLHGGAGADYLDGGTGSDTLDYSASGGYVWVDLSTGESGANHALGDEFINIEAVRGSRFDDRLTGDAGDNSLDGGAGDDILHGKAGNDSLYGGADDDDLVGGLGNDHLYGDEGDDSLRGGAGDDSLHGDEGDDSLHGDEGDDSLRGGAGDDSLYGNEGDDSLRGGAGDDSLSGGPGDDHLHSDAGADHLNGGTGSDTVDYSDSDMGVDVRIGSSNSIGGHAEGDRLVGIESVIGSAFDDRLTGDTGDDLLAGGAGDDHLDGDEGNDSLRGGVGNDSLQGDTGDDRLYGDEGNDSLNGGADDDGLFGAAGDDWLNGGAGDDSLDGGADDDNLFGDEGNDRLDGGAGDDSLDGGAGDDHLYGDEGNDRLDGGADDDSLDGGADDDHLYGDEGNDRLDGGAGDDNLGGGVGNDFLHGNAGNDNVNGDEGNDFLYGGAGNDNVNGNEGNDFLYGEAGDDELFGDAGDDWLYSSTGADYLDGGAGQDWVDYWDSDAGVTVNLATGESAGGHAQGDELINIENVTGSRFDDVLTGDTGDDSFFGNAGDDHLHGGGGNDGLFGDEGNDNLSGGDGNDGLHGGAGADRLDGGAGQDRVDYWDSDAGVTVNLATGESAGGHAQGDELINIENVTGSRFDDVLTGDAGDNIFSGNAGDDHLHGGGGNDFLHGNAGNDNVNGDEGNDFLYGGAGADRLDGGAGQDWVDYWDSDAGVTVNLATGESAGGHAQGDELINIENVTGSRFDDVLTGDTGDDIFFGNAGDDHLHGGGGNDFLNGDAGADRLNGGPGADTFEFAGEHGNDVVTDFTNGEDRIDLSAFGLAGFDDLNVSSGVDGVTIDLTAYNGGTVLLEGFEMTNLDASDFVFVS